MSDGMFIVREDGTLVAMGAGPFESDDAFQTLLAACPTLLAGDALDPESPRRWLLVAREQKRAAHNLLRMNDPHSV